MRICLGIKDDGCIETVLQIGFCLGMRGCMAKCWVGKHVIRAI